MSVTCALLTLYMGIECGRVAGKPYHKKVAGAHSHSQKFVYPDPRPADL